MKSFAYDLETSSLDVHTCILLGIAISYKPNEAYYITLDDDKDKTQDILETLKPFFEDPSIEKIGQNLKFDNHVLKRYGIEVKGRLHDTMVADYVVFPHRKKHGLKLLSKLHLNYQQVEFGNIAIGKTKKDKTLVRVNPAIVMDYACDDVDQTLKLFNHLLPLIEQNKLMKVYDMDCALVRVITEMEYNGVKIDLNKLETIKKEIDVQLCEAKTKILGFTNSEINLNSPKDLNRFLFDELDLVTVASKNKNGLRSVSSNELKKLLPQHEVVKLILDYRALFKVKSTYFKALSQVNPATGRLHTSLNQTVTETGRLSSSRPNLQSIPSRTIGSRLRLCFVSSSPKHCLIGADYSNIELRIMAVYSQDPLMLAAYKSGADLHSLTASKVLGINVEKVDKGQRNIGKVINFGLIYGMTAQGLAQSLTLNTEETFTVQQCQQFINDYFELYQGVAKCREDLIHKATINGYTETLFGRKRPLPNIDSSDTYKREASKRLALNTPIQGTAADIIKLAMINIDTRILNENLKTKMVLQVHDELLFDVPLVEKQYMEKLIRYEMENAVKLAVPLEVDLKSGNSWAEVH